MRDTLIAEKLRLFDLKVVEVAGWRARGSDSFNPRGMVWHHTAGPLKGNAPSLQICTNGRRDLPGPLCNVLQGRDNTIYVIAAGRANHAGAGRWNGLTGNASVYGLEVENVGTSAEQWRPDQVETSCRVAAALTADAARCCHHKEWALPKGRKPDMHSLDGDTMRARVGQLLRSKTNELGDDMAKYVQDSESGEIFSLNWEQFRKLSQDQYNARAWLSAVGGKPLTLEKMHPWELAAFAMQMQLVELTPPAV